MFKGVGLGYGSKSVIASGCRHVGKKGQAMTKISWMAVALLACGSATAGTQEPKKETKDAAQCPLHEQHMKERQAAAEHDHAAMNRRGEDARGMGFSQTETTHHFLLTKSGGVIQVEVNDAKNTALRETVRKHLQVIAESFAKGNFSIPGFVHGKEPDGVKELKELKSAVQYRYEDLASGGRVVLAGKSDKAARSVHRFLRFQIYEHRTGDSMEVPQ